MDYFEYSPSPKLVLAFFTRRGGVSRGRYESLNTSYAVGDDAGNVGANLQRARQALGLPVMFTLKQIHSDKVLQLDREWPAEAPEADAFYTSISGLGLGLKVADCLPVYLYSEDSSCIGIAHCGWRGTAARLAEKTAREMSRHFAVPLTDLRFALGPCVCPNCYEVGDDVREEFGRSFPLPDEFFTPITRTIPVRQSPVAKYRLDIRAANRWLLMELGLLETRSIALCTFEEDRLFYSARRDRLTGRCLAVIALR